jgi:hypothetical protein
MQVVLCRLKFRGPNSPIIPLFDRIVSSAGICQLMGENGICASVPNPKFARLRGELFCELRVQSDTRITMLLVLH